MARLKKDIIEQQESVQVTQELLELERKMDELRVQHEELQAERDLIARRSRPGHTRVFEGKSQPQNICPWTRTIYLSVAKGP